MPNYQKLYIIASDHFSQPAEHQQMTNAKVITLTISLAAILSTQPASANDTDILIEGLLAQIYTAEIERYVLNPCGHELAKLESKRQIDLLIEQLGGIEKWSAKFRQSVKVVFEYWEAVR